MMSSELLARATFSFRRGYLDAYSSITSKTNSDDLKPFGEHDYQEGRRAAQAEQISAKYTLADKRNPIRRAQMLSELAANVTDAR